MKKSYIAMTVLATVSMVACQQEKSFDELTPIGENGIAFALQSISTRSTDENPTAVKGITIPLDSQVNGESFYLEETIENLNPVSPATKGTPAYTVNVGKLYPTMGVYAANLGDATFEVMDMYDHKGDPSDPKAPTTAKPETDKGDGWRYHHNYSSNPWPDEITDVNFFLRMPASDDGFVVPEEGDVITYSDEKKTISFDYISEVKGEDQNDILFAQSTLSKKEHDKYLPNGAPVLMYHALTGVKFRIGNNNTGSTKTIITKVRFKGLKDQGHCEISFNESIATYTWTPAFNGKVFEQEFTNPDYQTATEENPDFDTKTNPDGTVSYGSNEGDVATFNGTSWVTAAADHNLNDENGSMTFWFIPQEIEDNVTLEVTFCVKTPDTAGKTGGGLVTHTIDFGKQLNKGRANKVKWEAGQLRTYTLEPKEVDVEIFDSMKGMTKSGLHVTNTGNVDEYVRMLLIGNWYGWTDETTYNNYQAATTRADSIKYQPTILVGYQNENPVKTTDSETGQEIVSDPMVEPWYRKTAPYSNGFDNTFSGGAPNHSAGNAWVKGTGSYFYYPYKIGAGEQLDSQTQALFKSYSLENITIPTIWIPSLSGGRIQAIGVHLVLNCVIQAIGADGYDDDDENNNFWKAWSDATGKTIEEDE